MNWRKSGRSKSGNCVEAASWRKPSGSYGTGVIGIRDTKLGTASPVLEYSTDAWQAFIRRLRQS